RNLYWVQERRDHFLNAPATSCQPLSSSASLSVKQEIWPRVSVSPRLPQLYRCPSLLLPALRWSHRLSRFFHAPPRSLFPLESSAHALVRRRRESLSHKNVSGTTLRRATFLHSR